jgi:uncharacterized protein (DUF1697 family)
MKDLRAAFEAAGCSDVRSFIQSGNVVFQPPPGLALQQLTERLSAGIGAPLSVLYRASSDLDEIAASHPFRPYLSDLTLKLYVVFLDSRPARQAGLPVIDEKEQLELIAVEGQEAYLVSRRKPNGMYGFPTIFLERELGVTATARNWSTVSKLIAFLQQGANP